MHPGEARAASGSRGPSLWGFREEVPIDATFSREPLQGTPSALPAAPCLPGPHAGVRWGELGGVGGRSRLILGR